MNKTANTTTDGGQEPIEQLQKRYQALNTRKIQAETNLENAKSQLDKLKAEARDKYGTDDVEQLQQRLAEMQAENERKRSDYQKSLDKIESDLQAVEAEFAGGKSDEDEDSA